MHDFGFSQLRIVNDYPVPFQAAKSAVDASSVLEAATEHASVAEAVADCTLVLGTTAVGARKLDHPLHTLSQAVPIVAEGVAAGRVALLFGSEKTGLSNEEISHCHALLTIPMQKLAGDRHLSMNLGQAAAVCLYAIAQADTLTAPSYTEALATSGDLERLTGMLQEVLDTSGYTKRHPANSRETNVRRLVRRMANSSDDAAVWSGVLRQLLHVLKS
jgi:tRNA/rRNA methyltransferase